MHEKSEEPPILNERFCLLFHFQRFGPPELQQMSLAEVLLHSRCGRLPSHMFLNLGGTRSAVFARDEVIRFFARNYPAENLRALLDSGFDLGGSLKVKPLISEVIPRPLVRKRNVRRSKRPVTLRRTDEGYEDGSK